MAVPWWEHHKHCHVYYLGVCGWQKITSVRFCKKNYSFRFIFGFTKYNCGFGFFFGSVRPTFVSQRRRQLSFMPLWYDARNDVLLCWIVPTNCQPKWLRTRNAEIWHEEKYFDCWSYHAARWIVNMTTWQTVPKPPKSFFKPNRGNPCFRFLNFEVG